MTRSPSHSAGKESSPPPAPSRLSRQRSRPLVAAAVDDNAAAAAASSLDGTFNVNSIEDDPNDPPPEPKTGRVGYSDHNMPTYSPTDVLELQDVMQVFTSPKPGPNGSSK